MIDEDTKQATKNILKIIAKSQDDLGCEILINLFNNISDKFIKNLPERKSKEFTADETFRALMSACYQQADYFEQKLKEWEDEQ